LKGAQQKAPFQKPQTGGRITGMENQQANTVELNTGKVLTSSKVEKQRQMIKCTTLVMIDVVLQESVRCAIR